jgi:integrase
MAARVLELLRRTINYGIKRGLVAPINFKIEIPRLNNQTTEDLSPDQIKKLIRVLDTDKDQTAANVMRLALFTGMRRGEIFKLKWENVDFRRGFITIADPKGGPDQTIPLNDAARKVLESIKTDDAEPWVFPGRFPGTHLTNCRDSFARIAKAAKFPQGFRPLHGLRHVYASMLASSGQVDLYTLQKLMTHKSPLMTQRYAHLRDDALKKAANLAGDIVTGIETKAQEAAEKAESEQDSIAKNKDAS